MITKDKIIEALRNVQEPELKKDIVTLNMVRDVEVNGKNVSLTLVLTTPACPLVGEIKESITEEIKKLGADEVKINLKAEVPKNVIKGKIELPQIKNIVAIYSCKGGVGKSTLTVEVAAALVKLGSSVGVLDADIYGPNIPRMFNVFERLYGEDDKIIPAEKHGIKFISMGFLVPDEKTPAIWRGPIVSQVIRQFLMDVNWGEVDYLLIDLPPGTGDIPITIAQNAPLAGVVGITTPQDVAVEDTLKGIEMFNKFGVETIGVVINMENCICPNCRKEFELFSKGELVKKLNLEILGSIPYDRELFLAKEEGTPLAFSNKESTTKEELLKITKKIAAKVSVLSLRRI